MRPPEKRYSPATKPEASALTSEVREHVKHAEKIWWKAIKVIDLCLHRRVPEALGQSTKEWMAQNVDGSLSDAFRKLRRFRALQGVSEEAVMAMPGKNIDQLTRLTKEERVSPRWVSLAQDLAPEKMVERVDAVLEKRGIKKEVYQTWSLRVTQSEFEEMNDVENKIAGVLGLDTDKELSPSERSKCWGAVRSLVLTTEAEHIVIEIKGGD